MPPLSEPRSLADLCLVRACTHPDRPAVDDGDTALSYAELADRAGVAAALLGRHGVRAGDRVLVVGRNSTDWVVAAFGALLAGAALVPLGHGSSPVDRERAMARLRPRLVLAEEAAWAGDAAVPVLPLAGIAHAVPDPRHPPAPAVSSVGLVDPDAEALVMGTSGTTGAVKYVAMSHGQLARLYGGVSRWIGLHERDRLLGAVPLAHSFGLNGVLLIGFQAGACVRLTRGYDRTTLADLVREERLTVLAGPPTVYHDLAAAPDRMGRSVRLAITGSTEVFADQIRETCDALGIGEVVVGYGMTETCGTVALGRIEHPVASPTAAMTPVDGIEVRIADDRSEPIPPGRSGRLQVRGFNVLRRYADEPGDLLEGDWFDTGDVGRLDDDGRLSVVSRRKDTVIVSGFNVYPQEVERVLASHPAVARAAVVGMPDERRGQRLVACVVAAPGTAPTAEELVEHARERLSAYKVPHEYTFLDDLPVTATGKLSRAAVRRALESH